MTLQPIPFVLLLLALVIELCRGVSISGCKADERNALLNLKKNVEDKHSRLASWKDEDCCNWEGVSCNNVTGHVVRLDLRNPYHCSEIDIEGELFADIDIVVQCKEWSLRGHLSPSLVGLKQLNYLDLSINQFDGPIPRFLGSLHNLRYLNLSLAGFHGFIPHHLGNLSRLKYLHLNNIAWNNDDNPLAINIDDSRWIYRLTSLKHLTMTYTKFENFQNWIEALNELPNIAEIRLSYCHINGFPLSLPYVNFTNLSYLDLSYNSIYSKMIPLWLFNIKSLTHIDLSYNYFISSPDALKNLTSSLEYIDFSGNDFSGALPQVLKSLRKVHTLNLSYNYGINGSLPNWLGELHMLEYLDLSENSINGYLPNSLGELQRLKSLDLSYNGLFGCIPESLGRLVALQQLFLSGNKLNGTVPKSIGQLSNLISLSLDSNFFEGVISEVHFASLAKLKVLDLGSNKLILNVSRDWIFPFKLNILRMGSCKIGPEFPRWLQTQVNLSYLDLSSSHIVDFLPHWFWDVFVTHDTCVHVDLSNNGITGSLPHLSKLCFDHFNLSSNCFSGPLPPTLNISGSVMDISNNSFYGPINPFICNTNPLDQMSLSGNNFNGKIPSCICLTNAQTLDFSRNLLTDELPDCWGAYKGIELLDFSRNNISGNIPHTLCTLTNLVILHLDNNILSGNIPHTLGNLTNLMILHLDNNILSGNIPHTLGTLTNLVILHLDNNILSGNIPPTFENCTQLKTFDLSFNNLNGQIPIWFGENLSSLRALVLGSNNFTGNIPANLWKLKLLRILYLGNNNLIGRIPRSFGNFTNMIDIHEDDESRFIDSIQLLIKGKKWMYHELLSLITIIDLSCNKLSGQIPREIGNLRGLRFLNLSENHLVGSIPDEIGLMHSLESLDMSKNGLSGNIPLSMATMTTLAVLNLSYNNLSGKIPSGNQLQTFTNKSYIGNPELCGFPLTQSCDSNKTTNVEVSMDEVIESDYWYVSIAPGFVLGFWIVWGTLFLKKKWKDAYFRYVDYVYDAIFLAISVNINRFKRKLGNEIASG